MSSNSCTLLTLAALILANFIGPAGAVYGAEPVTASFTDSQGRTLLFRYSLKDDWDPTQPRGLLVFFHGNNKGSQDDMLRYFFRWIEGLAWPRGLIPVVPASPGSADRNHFDRGSVRGTRYWDTQEDIHLVHELLQSGLGGSVSVDHGRIVFFGGSQGTIFLNRFFEKYGERYGGGLYAWCGDLAEVAAEHMMVPSPEFKNKFRVFVQATTEDFVHAGSVKAFGHYKYTLGLETRGDLTHSGPHCAPGEIGSGTAIDWLLGDAELPDDPPRPHFRRVSALDYIRGMTVDSGGVLWVVRQPPYAGEAATLWRSVDRGNSWESVARIGPRVTDLDAVHDELLLATDSGLYRSADRGVSFQRVLPHAVDRIVTDPRNGVFLSSRNAQGTFDIRTSVDAGRTWTVWSTDTGALQRDPILVRESTHVIAGNAIRSTEGGSWSAFSDAPLGPVQSAAWDGSTLWGIYGRRWDSQQLLKSADKGASWMDSGLEAEGAERLFSAFTGISALGGDRLLVYQFNFGGIGHLYGTALMSGDLGRNWASVLGGPRTNSGQIGQQWIAAHPQFDEVFVTGGTGIFSLEVPDRADRLDVNYLINGTGITLEDADSDGVFNAGDAFPFDGLEYLDTDGDGIGNGHDLDDDGDGVVDAVDGAPLDRFESVDADGDGIGNEPDPDDDGDRVEDIFDAFPLDPLEWADADGDGIGDVADPDDDGDGVDDFEDPFPHNSLEWLDTDGDGIGDNADRDDDNDGLEDDIDEEPRRGEAINGLAVTRYRGGTKLPPGIESWVQHPERPDIYSYPEPRGNCPVYGSIRLGDGAMRTLQWMMDTPGCGYGSPKSLIHLDRNGNGILTDDGPAIIVDHNRNEEVQLDVRYASGDVFPYYLSMGVYYSSETGAVQFRATGSSMWSGELKAPGGPVAVWVVDGNSDAVFQTFFQHRELSDFLCIDLNRDRRTDCWPWEEGSSAIERVAPGAHFTLDGQRYRADIPPSGHKIELVPASGGQ